jgi:mannose-6-phosphate isomerase-like protein (cupin superfamily)
MPSFAGRRTFFQVAAMWVGSTRLARAREQAPGRQGAAATPWRGTVLQLNEGEHLISGRRRAPMRIKIDSTRAAGARMSMVISEVAPGAAIPIHRHRNEDELIFIHTGQGAVTLGDARVDSKAGAMLYAPKGVWHGIENTGSETLTWCAVFSPPGFEQFFREVGVPPDGSVAPPSADQVTAIGLKYGMEFKTP